MAISNGGSYKRDFTGYKRADFIRTDQSPRGDALRRDDFISAARLPSPRKTRKPPAPPADASAVLRKAVKDLASSSSFRDHMAAISERAADYGSEQRMTLAAIGMEPRFRARVDEALDAYWAVPRRPPAGQGASSKEIVIGAGLHAAVYCANRVAEGFPKPVVLEMLNTPGGAFAWSRTASFRLNSDNVPGLPGVPGRRQGLNYLPGAAVQAADMSGEEFTDNTMMAWAIRTTLALHADVYCGVQVSEVREDRTPAVIKVAAGQAYYADRVIDARGLGVSRSESQAGPNVLTFPQFCRRMDRPWPLRGVRRWAVVGGGDAGRCAIEALLGIGPQAWPLDYVDDIIDWYAPNLSGSASRLPWRTAQRGRYSRIGSYLSRDQSAQGQRPPRVRIIPERGVITPGIGDFAAVNGRAYGKVIACTGFERRGLETRRPEDLPVVLAGGGTATLQAGSSMVPLGRQLGRGVRIGPAAALPYSATELNDSVNVTRNADSTANLPAIFRLAWRTAALARILPA